MAKVPGVDGYAHEAPELIGRYEARTFEYVHADILHLLPAPPAFVLDIGAGTGRDAAGLSKLGYAVTAVEPVDELRQLAMEKHADCVIEWIDDGLPNLEKLALRPASFDLIMLTAVFMHIDAPARQKALGAIANLAKPDGLVRLSLRHGPVPEGRTMFDVSGENVIQMAAPLGLVPVHQSSRAPQYVSAPDVTWTDLVLRKV